MFNLKSSFLLPILFIVFIGNAQQVYVETGLGSAFFEDYVNNLGENTLDESYSRPKTPFFEAGFRFNVYKKRIKFDIGTNYSTYKINTAFLRGNVREPLFYDLSYLSLKAGFNFSVIKWKKLRLQLHTHLSHDWLTAGTSKYNNVFNDLVKDETFDKTLIRIHFGLGTEYVISDNISAYLT